MIKRQLRSEDFGSYRLVKNELVRKVVKIGEIPLKEIICSIPVYCKILCTKNNYV